MGLNMTVEAQTEWQLRTTLDEPAIWREHINTDYTATVGDAFVGLKRLRLANEGAIRENISVGLKKLSKLKL